MRLLYTIIQLVLAPPFILYLISLYFVKNEKWDQLIARLGLRFTQLPPRKGKKSTSVIWIHALSVGEATSSFPLIRKIREARPDVYIVLSCTTRSGCTLARGNASSFVDLIVPFPLDIVWVVKRYLDAIDPDLFILVETDFWPHFLNALSARKIPSILVNGRVSEKSFKRYRFLAFFFKPMFNSFDTLCMQTQRDVENMRDLGILEGKVRRVGNLKCGAERVTSLTTIIKDSLHPDELLIICGSTHQGEEKIILSVYAHLVTKFQGLKLAIAPRDPSRVKEVQKIIVDLQLEGQRYSAFSGAFTSVLLIDTIGDLAGLYSQSDIAFIGGSLVPEGGHNPLEAAMYGIPLLFGPHMEDFLEISQELMRCKAAFQVSDDHELASALESLLLSEQLRRATGSNGRGYFDRHGNVLSNHLKIIEEYL